MYGLKNVRNRRDDALSRVSWQDFERLLADYYQQQGYRVDHVGTGKAGSRFDGGIDLKLFRGDEYLLVQCKRWNKQQVPHNVVHELLGVMLTEQATGIVVVTSGEFTDAAKAAAAKRGDVRLIDGETLRHMVGVVPEPEPNWSALGGIWDVSPRSYRPARRSARRDASFSAYLARVAFAVVAALACYYFVQHELNTLSKQQIALNTAPSRPVPRQPAASAPVSRAPTSRSRPAQAQVSQRTTVQAGSLPMTKAELREWERENAKSMAILDKTTPDVARCVECEKQ